LFLKPVEAQNKKSLEYPFSFLSNFDGDGYSISSMTRGLLDESPFEIGNFPKNILTYYWIHEGENDEEPWHLFCKIDTPDTENRLNGLILNLPSIRLNEQLTAMYR
jgi:hypothetical protein